MATITEERVETIELTSLSPSRAQSDPQLSSDAFPPEDAAYSTTAIPDGGYGWVIVLCCSIIIFWNTAIISCWGILQAALLDSKLQDYSPSTLSFVGSLGLAGGAAYGLLATRVVRYLGSRITAALGVSIMGMSLVASGLCTSNLAGLFGTTGIMGGVGCALVYAISNILPVQYFSGHLGLANGLVKLGGGIGGCIMAVALEALNRRVGIEWTFITMGLLCIATGLPAAFFLKDRAPLRNTPFVDWSMFKSLPFVAVFLAGAIGTFSLFVPSYYLPLFAQSLGMSSSTGAGLVAAFNACNAVGRFVAGPLCDKIGPINMFLITMLLQAVSMLAIWPVSNSLGPLVVFAILNGVANGSTFTTFPTVVAGMFGPGRAAVAMSMAVTGWTGGNLTDPF
jgi:MFS family permease